MSDNKQVANPFGAITPADQHTLGASALGASNREVAEVQAALVAARSAPRNQRASMDRIIDSCSRPGLAEVAVYQYSRGGSNISGPSIRLAEEMARQWGNIACGIVELSRGRGVSECLAYCWDMESNFRDEKRFQVRHWRDTKQGGYELTDERDIYELIANMGSRRKRACILSVIPGDVQDSAVRQAELTLKTSIDITPEMLEAILVKFAEYGVTKQMIEERVQRRWDVEALSAGHILTLRKIYSSLRDGMSAPGDWFNTPENVAEDGTQSAAQKMKAAAEKSKQARATKEAPEKAPEPEKKAEPEPDPEPEPEPEVEEKPTPTPGAADLPGLFGDE